MRARALLAAAPQAAAVAAYTITVRIAGRALLRAQDGVDLPATTAAFVRVLEPVLRRDVAELASGEASLEVAGDVTGAAHRVEVEGPDGATARRIEREIRDLVWVVREMVPFAVR